MGRAKRRISPAVRSAVDSDIDRLAVSGLYKLLRKEEPPYIPDPRGNPVNPKVMLGAHILKAFFVETYPGAEARLKDSATWRERFGKRVPSKSAMQENMGRMAMKQIRRILRRLIRKVSKKFAADSSGFRTKDSCRWFDVRIGRKNSRRDYLKLHLLVDVETGFVVDFHLTGGRAHDSPPGRRMLRRQVEIKLFVGDGAYANRKTTQVVYEKGGISRVSLRPDVTHKSRGSPGWKATVTAFQEDAATYEAVYHIRSFIEAVFSSIKRRFGRALHAIKGWHRRRELALKVVAYNLRHVLYWNEADARRQPLYEDVSTKA